MKVRKAIKQVVALGAGLSMLGATLMGAMADLSDFPAPFVQDGQADFLIVIGERASVADVIGAIDIATSLQVESVTTTTVSIEGAAQTNVVGGVEVAETGDNLNLNQAWEDAKGEFTDKDFPDLLADGVVEDDDDNEEYDYRQSINLDAGPTIMFGRPDDDLGDDPVVYLDLTADPVYTLEIDFVGQDLDITQLTDNEELEMFGIVYTFDNGIDENDEIVLYGSDVTATVNVGETITIAGIEISVTGANTDSNTAIVVVNGATKQVEEGDYVTVGGTQLYVKNIFLQTIPVESAAVEFFVGSTELTIPACDGVAGDVEIDGDSVDGVSVLCTGTNNTDVDMIQFMVTPGDFENDLAQYLLMGEKLDDPLFGTFELNFAGVVPDLMDEDGKIMSTVKVSGDKVAVTVENEDSDTLTFYPYELDGADLLQLQEDWGPDGMDDLEKDHFFIENSGDVWSVFTVDRIYKENNVEKVDIENNGDGTTRAYTAGEALIGTQCTVGAINYAASPRNINLTGANCGNDGAWPALERDFWAKNDLMLQFDIVNSHNATDDAYTITFGENLARKEAGDVALATFTIDARDDVLADSEDWDLGLVDLTETVGNGFTEQDEDNNYEYYLSEVGTYAKLDYEDNTQLEIWYPFDEEAYFQVFVAPTGAQSISSGGASGVDTQIVNPIGVGAAVMDSDAPSPDTANLLIVGGPCANTVAATLMGNPANCVAGFVEGRAKIKYWARANDHASVMAAGYSALGTQGASRVLANYEDYDLEGDEVEVTVIDLSTLTVAAPMPEPEPEPEAEA
jgi:hypothetical protein